MIEIYRVQNGMKDGTLATYSRTHTDAIGTLQFWAAHVKHPKGTTFTYVDHGRLDSQVSYTIAQAKKLRA